MNNHHHEGTTLEYLSRLKLSAQEVAGHFLADSNTLRDGMKILECANRFRTYSDEAYGTFFDTWYCKHRSCPICQWRKSLRYCSRVHRTLDQNPFLLQDKWIYLTLTVRNCDVNDLRATIEHMNQAFRRLMNRDFWKRHVRGGIRFVEVTESFFGGGNLNYISTHPHFHCLLRVSPSMHGGVNYISEMQWAEEWQQALQVHYLPIVNSRRLAGEDQHLRNKIISATRYSMKPRVNPPARSWFLAAAKQMRGLRLVEPFGDIRALFANLDDEASPGSTEGRNEIRQGHNPTVHVWDDSIGSYRSE
ncbi:protein rep [Marinobacter salarius]|jgi:plasmid rolling circle replication initiator protein Rep|uniref:Replication protein n=1 Tax=Marinobacter salarius TaxID=1420917 RepID=A0A1W6KBH6_9GAMM|nr:MULTISPECIES: protein rep [Marinobacter]ARM84763.1 replication protein [Marinobacter salarius]AZR39677.1 protein rep [Marinobacter salarius]MBJ7302122.1 protein rep [Marinobacter salarius]